MNRWFYLGINGIVSIILALSLAFAEEADSINYDNELKISGAGIDELQEKLHKAVEKHNELVKQKAHRSIKNNPHENEENSSNQSISSQDLKDRLKVLEEKVKVLEKKLSHLPSVATEARIPIQPSALVTTSATAQYNQAHALFKNEEYTKARDAFKQIISAYPQDPYAKKSYLHWGNSCLKLGEYDEAIRIFRQSLTLNLETAFLLEIKISLAEALLKNKDLKSCCHQLRDLEKEVLSIEQKDRVSQYSKAAGCSKA